MPSECPQIFTVCSRSKLDKETMKNDFIISWEQVKDINYNLEANYLTISCLIPLGIVRMMSLRGLGVVVCTVAKDPKSLSTTAEEESQPTNGNMYSKVILAQIGLKFYIQKISNTTTACALKKQLTYQMVPDFYQVISDHSSRLDQRVLVFSSTENDFRPKKFFKKSFKNIYKRYIIQHFSVNATMPNDGFHLHLLVFPFVYQFHFRIEALVCSSFANDQFRRISPSFHHHFKICLL